MGKEEFVEVAASTLNCSMADCKLCKLQNGEQRILSQNKNFYSLYDTNPATKGHAIIISKRHVASAFELADEEVLDMHKCLKETERVIKKEFKPDGYNIGINDGEVAGQTIFHLHVHLFPRYKGDSKNPAGGVRNMFPGKGDYLKKL